MHCSIGLHKHNLNSFLVFTWKFISFSFINSSEIKNKSLTSNRHKLELCNRNYCNTSNNEIAPSSICDLHKEWVMRFDANGVPESEPSIRYIIEHVLDIRKSYEYELNQNKKVTEEQENQIRMLCECRLARMPVQYIIKEWDFRDLRLSMCPPVFIPRPETEQLVDLVVEAIPANSVILEVGCGSGAISLSLLKALPQARVIAIDQSKLACQLTRKNSQLNDLTTNLEVVHSKLKEDGSLSAPLPLTQVDVLVSNPPYVPAAQMLDLQPEIKLYEDLRALEAGRDGLRVVKALILLAQTVLKSGGGIFLEVDSSHPKLIEKWLTEHPEINIQYVKTFRDFCEKERFVQLKKL